MPMANVKSVDQKTCKTISSNKQDSIVVSYADTYLV